MLNHTTFELALFYMRNPNRRADRPTTTSAAVRCTNEDLQTSTHHNTAQADTAVPDTVTNQIHMSRFQAESYTPPTTQTLLIYTKLRKIRVSAIHKLRRSSMSLIDTRLAIFCLLACSPVRAKLGSKIVLRKQAREKKFRSQTYISEMKRSTENAKHVGLYRPFPCARFAQASTRPVRRGRYELPARVEDMSPPTTPASASAVMFNNFSNNTKNIKYINNPHKN